MPHEEKETTNKSVDAKEQAGEERTTYHNHRHANMPLIVTLVVIAGILLITAIASVTTSMFTRMQSRFGFDPDTTSSFIERSGNRSSMMNRMFVRNSYSTSTTTSDIASGVVTSVNGNSFVIAGNGNQYTVNTTGNTTYNTTDKKVSVNDSVVVVGKITDKTIAATDVQIINY